MAGSSDDLLLRALDGDEGARVALRYRQAHRRKSRLAALQLPSERAQRLSCAQQKAQRAKQDANRPPLDASLLAWALNPHDNSRWNKPRNDVAISVAAVSPRDEIPGAAASDHDSLVWWALSGHEVWIDDDMSLLSARRGYGAQSATAVASTTAQDEAEANISNRSKLNSLYAKVAREDSLLQELDGLNADLSQLSATAEALQHERDCLLRQLKDAGLPTIRTGSDGHGL